MPNKILHKKAHAKLTHKSDTTPVKAEIDDSARLKEIRKLVKENNRSTLDENLVICQIYMESRFEKNARGQGSTARGLMQLLKAPVRELYRQDNLHKPRHERLPEARVFHTADQFHDSAGFIDEATNIQTGTAYLQHLIDKEMANAENDPISEAYKDYRGIRNGVYYQKIKMAAEQLKANPDSMQVLRDMVK
jgi:soluble lytic murein transglycosylase-like protein